MWFRYRWILTFSHGLCVKIIRGADQIKLLSNEIDFLFSRPMNWAVGKRILIRLVKLINILDDVIFSASTLLYREEKDLIDFSERTEKAAERLLGRLKREKGKYRGDAKKLESQLKQLKDKKSRVRVGLKRKVGTEKTILDEDEARKKEYAALLHELTSIIEEVDYKVHHMYLGSKAQLRGTLNAHTIREHVIIRSNLRLGELIGRKGIESGGLIKIIRNKLHHFSRIVGKKKRLDIGQVKSLLKYCRMEANDLERVFLFVIQVSERVEENLGKVGMMISKEPRLKLRLIKDYNETKERLGTLRKDIKQQHGRLNREYKKSKIISLRDLPKQMDAAA